MFGLWTSSSIELQFQHMNAPPFNALAMREELRQRLQRLPDVNIPADSLTRRPNFPLHVLSNDAALQHFLDVQDWIIAQIKAATAPSGSHADV